MEHVKPAHHVKISLLHLSLLLECAEARQVAAVLVAQSLSLLLLHGRRVQLEGLVGVGRHDLWEHIRGCAIGQHSKDNIQCAALTIELKPRQRLDLLQKQNPKLPRDK